MNDENTEPTAGRIRRKAVAVAGAAGVVTLVAGGLAAGALSSASAESGGSASGRHGYGGPEGAGGGARPPAANGDTSEPGRNDEKALTGTMKARVEAAVKAKYPDATIQRSETDSDGVYEAHVVSAGERLTVLVGKDFTITGTETGPGGGPGRGGHGGRFDGPGRGGPGGAEGETPTPPSGSTT